MICLKCGNKLIDGAKFCNQCGAPTGIGMPSGGPVPPQASGPVPGPMPSAGPVPPQASGPAPGPMPSGGPVPPQASGPAPGPMPSGGPVPPQASGPAPGPMPSAGPVPPQASGPAPGPMPFGGPIPPGPSGPVPPSYNGPVFSGGYGPANGNGSMPVKKKSPLPFVLIWVAAAVAALVIGLVFFAAPKQRYNKQLALGADYVENLDYDNAIEAYKKAIEMDPGKPDAYQALAEVYIKKDDYDSAMAILEEGLAKAANSGIETLLSEAKTHSSKETSDGNKTSDSQKATNSSSSSSAAATPPVQKKEDIDIEVRQVENADFPAVSVYAHVTDKAGNTVPDLKSSDIKITEINANGNVSNASVKDVYKMLGEEKINVNLVLDASGSMQQGGRMDQAKNAAKSFLDYMSLDKGDRASIFSFNNYVYMNQDFTNDRASLVSAVDRIVPSGETALYDAIYSGVLQTYYENGSKCLIAFTDGAENASNYKFNDVVSIAQNTGIPVYIIGVNDYGYDSGSLRDLAKQCSGDYYSANNSDIQAILKDIYISIYKEQQDYYVFEYTSSYLDDKNSFRDLVIDTSDTGRYNGHSVKKYIPEPDISGAFSQVYTSKDYILPFSSQRPINDADLNGLSLAELRIARNEIFARHGRQFRDPLLNQWFYSKGWYLSIPNKYAPDFFDQNSPNPVSKLEMDNASYLDTYEKEKMGREDIFPNASNVLLSEYDLALTKPVLSMALSQMNNYPSTNILEQNKQLVQQAINKPEVSY